MIILQFNYENELYFLFYWHIFVSTYTAYIIFISIIHWLLVDSLCYLREKKCCNTCYNTIELYRFCKLFRFVVSPLSLCEFDFQ